jgi:hypothetical protein
MPTPPAPVDPSMAEDSPVTEEFLLAHGWRLTVSRGQRYFWRKAPRRTPGASAGIHLLPVLDGSWVVELWNTSDWSEFDQRVFLPLPLRTVRELEYLTALCGLNQGGAKCT